MAIDCGLVSSSRADAVEAGDRERTSSISEGAAFGSRLGIFVGAESGEGVFDGDSVG